MRNAVVLIIQIWYLHICMSPTVFWGMFTLQNYPLESNKIPSQSHPPPCVKKDAVYKLHPMKMGSQLCEDHHLQ